MKGISLPINAIIIIVLVLIVLLAIIALFYGVWPSGQGTINLEAAKNNACQLMAGMGCSPDTRSFWIANFDADKDGNVGETTGEWVWNSGDCGNSNTEGDSLAALCQCYYGISDGEECKRTVCRCK